MSSSLTYTPTETPTIIPYTEPPEPPRVPADRVPDNQPPANKAPTACWSQKIRNTKSNPSNSTYALATLIIKAIESLIHYEANASIDPIT